MQTKRNVYKLLLSLAVASAVVSGAEQGMRYSPDFTDRETAVSSESETETEAATTLMAALEKHFQFSKEMMQNYFRNQMDASPRFSEANDVVRIVVIDQEDIDPAVERKQACLKAMEITRKQEELKQQAESFMRYIRSAFDMAALRVWGGPSCSDLERPELVDQCKFVLESKDVIQMYRLEGRTDDQVCDIMSVVTDLNSKEPLSCHLCQRLVKMVDQAVSKDGYQVEHVRDIISSLGSTMSIDSKCLTFYNNYDMILQLVKYGAESDAICSRLTMCPISINDSGL